MLCRTANELFWMARHIERAENTARMLDVTFRMSLLPYEVIEPGLAWAEPWAPMRQQFKKWLKDYRPLLKSHRRWQGPFPQHSHLWQRLKSQRLALYHPA